MDSVLLGLFCLWFVCVRVTVSSVESNFTSGLFSWMDGQHQQDNTTTFDEFDQAWSHCDSNNDSSVSEEEVGDILTQLQLGPSSNAQNIFGGMDLKNKTNLKRIFNEYDDEEYPDGNITLPEFMAGYQYLVDLDGILGGGEHSRGKNDSYILELNNDYE